jgi:hypothetical protein
VYTQSVCLQEPVKLPVSDANETSIAITDSPDRSEDSLNQATDKDIIPQNADVFNDLDYAPPQPVVRPPVSLAEDQLLLVQSEPTQSTTTETNSQGNPNNPLRHLLKLYRIKAAMTIFGKVLTRMSLRCKA